MPDTGLVAVFRGVRKPFELREFPVPGPGPGAILVKVRMANICGSDLHIYRGDYDVSRGQKEPFCLSIGHEMAGEVAQLGEGVTHDSAGRPLAVGDRIAYQYFCGCGTCRSCLRGSTPRCAQGLRYRFPPTEYPHFNAAYGQYYYLRPGQAVFKIPDDVPDELAGPANCALSQVIYALHQGNVGPGDRLVIQGAGGLGLNAIAVAKERGVSQIIAVDSVDERLQLAREFGAHETLSMREFTTPDDRVKRVKALTGGDGADAVLEVAGTALAVPEGIGMLCSGGVYLAVGNINQGKKVEIDPSQLVHGGKSILGIMWYTPRSLLEALEFLSTRSQRYPFQKVLSHQYPLTRIDDAFRDQDAGHVQRASLLPWG
jgi:D-arabinose 1-dehydrogenase-like Zn-dependent alcohol dehydrogenase